MRFRIGTKLISRNNFHTILLIHVYTCNRSVLEFLPCQNFLLLYWPAVDEERIMRSDFN